ncbi:hypothetical protein AB0G05_08285 [Nonomuraea wenchangensis]
MPVGGDNSGITTSDGVRNVRMEGTASEQGRVYQPGGDHIEFHHSTFPGKVVGKQVNSSQPTSRDGNDDAAR